jgi:hypothetical protein
VLQNIRNKFSSESESVKIESAFIKHEKAAYSAFPYFSWIILSQVCISARLNISFYRRTKVTRCRGKYLDLRERSRKNKPY